MSALAQVLQVRGYIVSGSDVNPNNLTETIEARGGKVYIGHLAENIGDAQVIIYSSSITKDNPEMVAAANKGLIILHRGKLLAALMKEKVGVAVTGSHGKTTTASMISEIMVKAGYDPICVLGGESLNLGGNVHLGKGKYLVAEADESDGSHVYLEPSYGIITNIDREHLDYYKGLDDIISTNLKFLRNIRPEGTFFGLIDDAFIRKILLHYDRRFVTFGISREADLRAEDVQMEGLSTTFTCLYKGDKIGQIRINVPGRHNVLNALAATLFALHIGVDFEVIARALSEFKSTKRRFEIYPSTGDVMVIEDYAHHPAEISATIDACRLLKPKRVVTVFQPHRYTRTKELEREFGGSFEGSDELILTNVYAASEPPLEGVSVKNIFDKVREAGFKNVHIIPKDKITEYLYNNTYDGDLVAVLGAGDIGKVAGELAGRLKADG